MRMDILSDNRTSRNATDIRTDIGARDIRLQSLLSIAVVGRITWQGHPQFSRISARKVRPGQFILGYTVTPSFNYEISTPSFNYVGYEIR